ncbi:hypothetical protein BB560_002212 [Smittium megazygosporum]|uniref:EF-hand domain-containing protein n=1 Tax=Smittium megazygosporum TaxID=133381 RepID=A0A2T9ZFI0_9FUNG|nr:hypothetical protein BB560_002212 [Smittium megazygosporum]
MGTDTTEIDQKLLSTPKPASRSLKNKPLENLSPFQLVNSPPNGPSSLNIYSPSSEGDAEMEIKADEISMSTKWSPHVKSAEKKTIAQRLREHLTPSKHSPTSDPFSNSPSSISPASKLLESPDILPPVSPLVNSIKKKKSRDLLSGMLFKLFLSLLLFFSPKCLLLNISNFFEYRYSVFFSNKKCRLPLCFSLEHAEDIINIFQQINSDSFLLSELEKIKKIFDKNFGWNESDFIEVTVACGLPKFLNRAFLLKIRNSQSTANKRKLAQSWPEFSSFSQLWTKLRKKCTDKTHLIYEILLPENSSTLKRDDFFPVDEPSIFSYKHFYVIFCSFYELDDDHDGLIQPKNLLRYFDGSLSMRIINRVMENIRKSSIPIDPVLLSRIKEDESNSNKKIKKPQYMTYRDFIWFLIAEIDKTSITSADYWFRCLDLDNDGILTIFELEYFYDEQIRRMSQDSNGDIITLDDMACQILDLVKPAKNGLITKKDIYNMPCLSRPVLFDAFINLRKFCEHDSRSSALQKQLSRFTNGLEPGLTHKEIIERRVEFLNNAPLPWLEFADYEYDALIYDQQLENPT